MSEVKVNPFTGKVEEPKSLWTKNLERRYIEKDGKIFDRVYDEEVTHPILNLNNANDELVDLMREYMQCIFEIAKFRTVYDNAETLLLRSKSRKESYNKNVMKK